MGGGRPSFWAGSAYVGAMANERQQAMAEFRRIMTWIVGIGVVMAAGAITYLALTGELYLHLVVATLGGVFISVLLGCGLFALSFFSDKSGHDQSVNDATRTEREHH